MRRPTTLVKVSRKKNIKAVVRILKSTYPDAQIVLNYSNSWELVIAVMLSAQCTDKQVNKVTAKLFSKYKQKRTELREIVSFAKVELTELEKDIKSVGFYRNKAKNIKASAQIILERFAGRVPSTMEGLLSLPGVARKGANVILGNAFGIVKGIAVDTHVARISQRLRLVDIKKVGGRKPKLLNDGRIDYFREADAVKIEKFLMQKLPQSEWFMFTYLLIELGRARCKAVNPQCNECPVFSLCPVRR